MESGVLIQLDLSAERAEGAAQALQTVGVSYSIQSLIGAVRTVHSCLFG